MPKRNSVRITPPSGDPLLDPDILSKHVRDHRTCSYDVLQFYAEAAEAQLDGEPGILNLSLRTQVWQHTFVPADGSYISCVQLPYGPVQSIDAVTLDGNALVDGTDFRVVTDLGTTMIDVLSQGDGDLIVTATCGYGPNGEDVPANIRAAAYTLAAEMMKHRAQTISGPAELIQMAPLFEQIIKATSRVGETFNGWD